MMDNERAAYGKAWWSSKPLPAAIPKNGTYWVRVSHCGENDGHHDWSLPTAHEWILAEFTDGIGCTFGTDEPFDYETQLSVVVEIGQRIVRP